jgi:hypothetical protein
VIIWIRFASKVPPALVLFTMRPSKASRAQFYWPYLHEPCGRDLECSPFTGQMDQVDVDLMIWREQTSVG